MPCDEPQHTMGARSTATSASEGRIKVDVGGLRARKKRLLRKEVRRAANK